jgi:hypothetical protein
MKVFPIRVPRHPYRGNDEAKKRKRAEYNQDAATLETYLNEKIAADAAPIQQFIYGYIAPDVGLPEQRVREILFAVDTGHNGLTVAKSQQAYTDFMSDTKSPEVV